MLSREIAQKFRQIATNSKSNVSARIYKRAYFNIKIVFTKISWNRNFFILEQLFWKKIKKGDRWSNYNSSFEQKPNLRSYAISRKICLFSWITQYYLVCIKNDNFTPTENYVWKSTFRLLLHTKFMDARSNIIFVKEVWSKFL